MLQGQRLSPTGVRARSSIRSRPPSLSRSGAGTARPSRSTSSPQQRDSGTGSGPPVHTPGSPATSSGRRHLVRRPSLVARIVCPPGGVRALRCSVRIVPYGFRHPRQIISDNDRGPERQD
ncbi:hypothetical protein NDU88_003873 [Pleurodeles waltl]|uniref:Uncharacterized protein n=1 Tax=Pleurodeles waltl TaxID=8319 RepID=A0AAV7VEI5_PLEWA|nr:hypothetical protein NDU88_003873 [Pleurodeles waltl]